MKKVSLKPVSTILAQAPAGVAVEAIIADGILYLPAFEMQGLGEATKATPEPTPAKEVAPAAPAKATRGKKAAEPVAEASPEAFESLDDVLDALESLDAGDTTAEEIVARAAQGDKAIAKVVKKAVDEFVEDADAAIEEIGERIWNTIEGADPEPDPEPKKRGAKTKAEAPAPKSGRGAKKPAVEEEEEEEEEEEPAPAPKKGRAAKAEAPAAKAGRGKKAAAAEDEWEEVESSDLEKGDVVKVYWESLEESYTGVVTKIVKGVPTIKYDDDQQELAYDAEDHTKIERKL